MRQAQVYGSGPLNDFVIELAGGRGIRYVFWIVSEQSVIHTPHVIRIRLAVEGEPLYWTLVNGFESTPVGLIQMIR